MYRTVLACLCAVAAAAVTPNCNSYTDDAFSLIQKPASILLAGPTDRMLDLHVRFTISNYSSVEVNNLGGLGPDSGTPEELRIRNVTTVAPEDWDEVDPADGHYDKPVWEDAMTIDLLVTAESKYHGRSGAHNNGLMGGMGIIFVDMGKTDTFRFSFVRAGSYEKMIIPSFDFTVFDIDQAGDEQDCGEMITAWRPYRHSLLPGASSAVGAEAPDRVRACSSRAGGEVSDPIDPSKLNSSQAKAAIMFRHVNTSDFLITMTNNADEPRALVFAGTSAALLPPRGVWHEHPRPLACEMQPDGFCKRFVWSLRRPAVLALSNLGGAGPDQGQAGIRYSKVGMLHVFEPDSPPRFDSGGTVVGSSKTIMLDLLIGAEGPYSRPVSAENGVDGSLGHVGLAARSEALLVLSFVEAGTDEPQVVPSFDFTIHDIDNEQSALKGEEYVVYRPFSYSALVDSTAAVNDTTPGQVALKSAVAGDVEDPDGSRGPTRAQTRAAVQLNFRDTATWKVHCKNHGESDTSIIFGGRNHPPLDIVGVTTMVTLPPTAAPTQLPTWAPTPWPTSWPSAAPTGSPSWWPTAAPTAPPSASPSPAPTAAPSAAVQASPAVEGNDVPAAAPATAITAAPAAAPPPSSSLSFEPTPAPTASPSFAPTADPTAAPTAKPTAKPTAEPTAEPTMSPTKVVQKPQQGGGGGAAAPRPTGSPTPQPSRAPLASTTTVPPTSAPTAAPTPAPTAALTPDPTAAPTRFPTTAPTSVPPTSAPTAMPTPTPTSALTPNPTAAPTRLPTTAPTSVPTTAPTPAPTAAPTWAAPTTTATPTSMPTASPSASPTTTSTTSPTTTAAPTRMPTVSPSAALTPAPTTATTAPPSSMPTESPTTAPTTSATPTAPVATSAPTSMPTVSPSTSLTPAPTAGATTTPVATAAPSSMPTGAPSEAPTATPTAAAVTTVAPTAMPTASPVAAQTSAPTAAPTQSAVPPAATPSPSAELTLAPTTAPTSTTVIPTVSPTAAATKAPTSAPAPPAPATAAAPTAAPTAAATEAPTQSPVAAPTGSPTAEVPSAAPTSSPTVRPTGTPTAFPAATPTPTPAPAQPATQPLEPAAPAPSSQPLTSASPTAAPLAPTSPPAPPPQGAPTPQATGLPPEVSQAPSSTPSTTRPPHPEEQPPGGGHGPHHHPDSVQQEGSQAPSSTPAPSPPAEEPAAGVASTTRPPHPEEQPPGGGHGPHHHPDSVQQEGNEVESQAPSHAPAPSPTVEGPAASGGASTTRPPPADQQPGGGGGGGHGPQHHPDSVQQEGHQATTEAPSNEPASQPAHVTSGEEVGPVESPVTEHSQHQEQTPVEAPVAQPQQNPLQAPVAQSPAQVPNQAPVQSQAQPMGGGVVPIVFGDPHVMNVEGAKFDIQRTGNHTFLAIPRGTELTPQSFLEVHGLVTSDGDKCKDELYLVEISIGGTWLGKLRRLAFSTGTDLFNVPETIGMKVGASGNISVNDFARHVPWNVAEVRRYRPERPSSVNHHVTTLAVSLHIGPTRIKVTWEHHKEKEGYSNSLMLVVSSLARVHGDVGGLLGKDNHTWAASLPSECGTSRVVRLQDGVSACGLLFDE